MLEQYLEAIPVSSNPIFATTRGSISEKPREFYKIIISFVEKSENASIQLSDTLQRTDLKEKITLNCIYYRQT